MRISAPETDMSAPAQITVDQTPSTITLAADLGIEHADALKDDLMVALATDQAVVIDGASVERLHSAAIQVLCAFVRDRQSAGLEVQWGSTSQCLREAAELLGVDRMLGMQLSETHSSNPANTE